jgi:hypothetical protein
MPFLFNPPLGSLPSFTLPSCCSSHYFFAVFADAFNALSETVPLPGLLFLIFLHDSYNSKVLF